MENDDEAACYRAVASRDRRFDGVFYTGVRSTGIYCRPSCPARTPLPGNVTFHRTAAAAQAAGYRACKRCLPDATPGSPAWDLAGSTAGRAMRLIADGVIEREGVAGLARRLGYTPRHLTRLLTSELGAGPLALARAQRAQNARVLVETTDWRLADVAYAAGFASVRQFNDTIREVYATTPTALRRRTTTTVSRRGGPGDPVAAVALRLPVRTPFDAAALHRFLAGHATPGVESAGPGWYARGLRLPRGPARMRLELGGGPAAGGVRQVPCVLHLSDVRDVPAAIERCRRLLDADCDPVAVDRALTARRTGDVMAEVVRRHPGLRVPGHVDGDELALQTVLGQQVSVVRANRLAGGLAEKAGEPLPETLRGDGVERLFPTPARVAAMAPEELPMPRARGRALVGLAAALADGSVALDRSAPRGEVDTRLRALPGIGPWTAGYVAMRALGDPDVFLSSDLVARDALRRLGLEGRQTETWRPWRSYALMHLWTWVLDGAPSATGGQPRSDREES